MKFYSILLFIVLESFNSQAGTAPSKETYRKAIREHKKDLAICLKLKKLKDSGDKTILVEWQVDDSGSVREAKLRKSNTKNADVDNCIVEKVKSLTFPPAPSGQLINIVYPISFDEK